LKFEEPLNKAHGDRSKQKSFGVS